MTTNDVDKLRTAWRGFNQLNEELLGLALADGELDEGSAATLLARLVGHIQYSGLLLSSDPVRPALINTQYSPWNWGHSNPDTLYLSARIDDRHDYRVFGRLGTVSQTTFGVYTGKDDQGTAVKVLAEDLDIADDGSFEIFFGRAPQGTNWFELPQGAESFCAYQTYGDWNSQRKGTIRIECLGDVPLARPRTTAESVEAFDAHLAASRDLFTMWVKDIPARVFGALPKNVAIPPMQPPSAMAGAWFVPIAWELGEDQALVIEYEIPDGSPYAGICLTDRWSAMIDPETRQTSLNLGQSEITDDGHVRILLSTKDFGVSNWLDARGYRSGVVTWRASTPDQPGTPVVTVIGADEVDRYFDPSYRLTPAGRAAALAERHAHFAERNTP